MKRFYLILLLAVGFLVLDIQSSYSVEYKKDITIALDGSGDCTTFAEAFKMVRGLMDYTVTIHVRNGVYREKVLLPGWLENIDIVGEDKDSTIICWGDHANINNMGTFRTYTFRVDGNRITFRNLTIKNDAQPLGQAVALHTEGDILRFVNCRIVGNQDTIYTGRIGGRLLFEDCYIEGTTDFIFGSSVAWFSRCTIFSKSNSYVTAASTPAEFEYGYVFDHCKLIAAEGIDKVYLGRPWRPYAATVFMNCEIGNHIRPEGWHNWGNVDNEHTARYAEYNNSGLGANTSKRVSWCHLLKAKEAKRITMNKVFSFGFKNPFGEQKK